MSDEHTGNLWHGSWTGRIPTANRRLAARCVGGRARMYPSPEYAEAKEALSAHWVTRRGAALFDHPMDLVIRVSLWRVRDTDNAIKLVQDALEAAGVIKNDNLIRDIVVRREYHKLDEPDTLDVWLSDLAEDIARRPDGAIA